MVLSMKEMSNDYNNIEIYLSLENPCTFLLATEKTWKCIFNTELSQNCTVKQIMPFKTTVNWLFNYTWCYLVIGCFNFKNVFFQQTVVRVYYILNCLLFISIFIYYSYLLLTIYISKYTTLTTKSYDTYNVIQVIYR